MALECHSINVKTFSRSTLINILFLKYYQNKNKLSNKDLLRFRCCTVVAVWFWKHDLVKEVFKAARNL